MTLFYQFKYNAVIKKRGMSQIPEEDVHSFALFQFNIDIYISARLHQLLNLADTNILYYILTIKTNYRYQ